MNKQEKEKKKLQLAVARENLKYYVLRGDEDKINKLRKKIAKLEVELKGVK